MAHGAGPRPSLPLFPPPFPAQSPDGGVCSNPRPPKPSRPVCDLSRSPQVLTSMPTPPHPLMQFHGTCQLPLEWPSRGQAQVCSKRPAQVGLNRCWTKPPPQLHLEGWGCPSSILPALAPHSPYSNHPTPFPPRAAGPSINSFPRRLQGSSSELANGNKALEEAKEGEGGVGGGALSPTGCLQFC